MIRWLLRRKIAAFERAWNYDATYMREVLDADPRALMLFATVMGLTQYHKDVPLGAYYAAKIVGTMAEDCGPCTQLAVDMAARAGVSPATLKAIVSGDISDMPEGVALAVRFTRATLQHDWEADALREEVVRRWWQVLTPLLASGVEGSQGRALLLAQEDGLKVAGLVDEVLASLPELRPARAHAVADALARGDTAFSNFFDLLRAGIAAAVRDVAKGQGDEEQSRLVALRPLDAWGDVWHALTQLQDETERFSLDKRHAIVSGLGLLNGWPGQARP